MIPISIEYVGPKYSMLYDRCISKRAKYERQER